MISLRRFGDLSMTRLAKLSATDRTTLTRSIDSLIADGLVRREASPADRRIVVIGLTDAGRALLAKIRAEIRPLNQDVCANLTPEEQAAMRDGIAGLRDTSRPARVRLTAGTAQPIRDALDRVPMRDHVTSSPPYELRVERERARLHDFDQQHRSAPRQDGPARGL